MMNRILLVISLLLVVLLLISGCENDELLYGPDVDSTAPSTTLPVTEPATENTSEPITEPATEPATVPPTTEEPEPTEALFILSFAGDCTLGTEHDSYGGNGTFVQLVGDNYGYPFQNVLTYFENDDFTFVNLEGVFTETGSPADKMFRFRGPTTYSKILTAGSIEVVSLANNHTLDYGQTGFKNTKTALESENITYVEHLKTAMYTTESGLTIGIFGVNYSVGTNTLKNAIAQLKQDGAEVVVVSIHWGIEGSYRPISYQRDLGQLAIDSGADIVVGHHPHVLQPIETYKNGVIYYSLGNFSFGGNRNPQDKDTAIVQQVVIREPDGTIHLGDTQVVACRLSSVANVNDYCPTPFAVGSPEEQRVLSKLDGSFTGPDLVLDRGEPETTAPETTEPETTIPEGEEPTQPPVTEVPPTESQNTEPVETQPVTEAPVTEAPPAVTDPPADTPESPSGGEV